MSSILLYAGILALCGLALFIEKASVMKSGSAYIVAVAIWVFGFTLVSWLTKDYGYDEEEYAKWKKRIKAGFACTALLVAALVAYNA